MAPLYPTPHIGATPDDFAKTVLMPGDPLRAKMVAETYLENAVLVNNVRGIQGYIGSYQGKRISVMASGMGMPSIGIYSHELFSVFGVENIIRIGSAGALSPQLRLRDIVIGMGASTDSNYAANFKLPGTFAPLCSYELLRACAACADRLELPYHVGNLLSSDVFYRADATDNDRWREMGVLAVEMEAAALYMNAARLHKRALAICTVSDHIVTGESTSAEERQNSFGAMVQLALETAVQIDR